MCSFLLFSNHFRMVEGFQECFVFVYFYFPQFNNQDVWAYQWHWLNVAFLCSFVKRASQACRPNPKFQLVQCADWSALQMAVTSMTPSDGTSLWHPQNFRPRNRWVGTLDLDTFVRLCWPVQMHATLVFRSMHATIHHTMIANQHHMLWHRCSQSLCTGQIQRWTSRPAHCRSIQMKQINDNMKINFNCFIHLN